MRYLVVRGKSRTFVQTVERYLYDGQSVVSEPVETMFGSQVVIVESPDANAQYVADRLQSGMFGARVFDTRTEAEAAIAEDM